jgi:hypothetical protein
MLHANKIRRHSRLSGTGAPPAPARDLTAARALRVDVLEFLGRDVLELPVPRLDAEEENSQRG